MVHLPRYLGLSSLLLASVAFAAEKGSGSGAAGGTAPKQPQPTEPRVGAVDPTGSDPSTRAGQSQSSEANPQDQVESNPDADDAARKRAISQQAAVISADRDALAAEREAFAKERAAFEQQRAVALEQQAAIDNTGSSASKLPDPGEYVEDAAVEVLVKSFTGPAGLESIKEPGDFFQPYTGHLGHNLRKGTIKTDRRTGDSYFVADGDED